MGFTLKEILALLAFVKTHIQTKVHEFVEKQDTG